MTIAYRKVFVTGHRGMVGSSLCRLIRTRYPDVELITQSRSELDLTDEPAVRSFFKLQRPDAVIFAASRVGGIVANATYPVEFLTENVRMAMATIPAAYETGVKRFLYLGSTCIYPRMAPQPIREEYLLTSPLEKTNEAYALAKIVGLKLCEYYRMQYGALFHSAMPTNLYGPGDNYHPDNSHVIPGMIRRFHDAKTRDVPSMSIWGTGKPRREFLYVDDLADALLHLLAIDTPPDWVNVGTSSDVSIMELATMIAATVGYHGTILPDTSKPDGTPRKLTDTSALQATGWSPRVDLVDGLKLAYADFLDGTARGTLRSQ